jgi:hypothetical protein
MDINYAKIYAKNKIFIKIILSNNVLELYNKSIKTVIKEFIFYK